MNTHLIHGQQDGFVDWPYKVRSRVVSPSKWLRSSGQRLLLLTDHQRGQVFDQHALPVRTSHLHPFLRNWMRDKASEGWLHRCSCKREKQVQSLQGPITLQEKGLCHAHHTFQARGNLLPHTHTNGSRAQTQEAYRRHMSQVQEYELNNRNGDLFKSRTDEMRDDIEWGSLVKTL